MPLGENRVEKILKTVEQLRPMPTSVTRILRALDDPLATAGGIAELIGLDQALAANVLQIANSATLGYGPPCSNLADAVMRLGFKRIKTVVMGAGASGPLMRRLNGYRLGAGQLWNHSVATAMAAQWLSHALSYPDPEEAYVAGLLHDMGKLLLDQYVQVDYYNIIQLMSQYNASLLWEVEERLFGINHATVGGLMALKWNFPEKLASPIRNHHMPSLAMENERLAAVINVANSFATRDEIGLTDPAGKVIHPEAMRILGIDPGTIKMLSQQMDQYLKVRQS